MTLIYRHLIKTFVPPFFFGLTVTTFILMIDVLQRYVDLFLEKGIRFVLVSEALVLSLGHIFALSIPMAILVGTLMAVGHLAGDNEITALKANGVSLYRIGSPLFVIALFMTVGMVAYNHYVLPRSNHRLTNLLVYIHQQRPTFTLIENAYVEINEEYTIFVRGKEDKTGLLEDVRLFKRSGRGDTHPESIVAKEGRLRSLAPGRLQLELWSGEYHSLPDRSKPDVYHRTAFERQVFNIKLDGGSGISRDRTQRNERSMNLNELSDARQEQIDLRDRAVDEARDVTLESLLPLMAMVRTGEVSKEEISSGSVFRAHRAAVADTDRKARALAVKAQVVDSHGIRANRFAVEYHKKFAIPGACLVFVIIGIPLAVTTSRGGRGVSVGVSLAAYVVYYMFLSGGEKLADRGFLPPWLAMWAGNLVLGPLGLLMLYQSVQETKIIDFKLPDWARRLARRAS